MSEKLAYRRVARAYASCLFAVLLTIGFGAPAHAAVILLVDVSDPERLTFTSTDAFATDDEAIDRSEGISLLDFFTSPSTRTQNAVAVSSSLNDSFSPPGAPTAPPLLTSFTDVNSTLFNMFQYGDSFLQFSGTDRALTGEGVFNLPDEFDTILPAPGASGFVALGYRGASLQTTIGEWLVIDAAVLSAPSPAFLLLGGLMALGTVAWGAQRRNNRPV